MQTDLFCRDLTPDVVLGALQVGECHGQTAEQLVYAITGARSIATERRLRQVIEALRTAGHPIGSHPAHGYYLAANDQELDRTCGFLLDRAMTTLRQVSAMKRVALPDLRGQLGLPLEKRNDHAE
jgi:hypothetical protein